MNGVLLLFGFDLLPKILLIHGVMVRLGIKVLVVPRKDYMVSMENLLAGEHGDYDGGSLGGRMIVLCDVAPLDEALDALRSAGIGPDCLKAVLTEHNRKWTARQLYAELLRERKEVTGK